jgi:CrcB protein
MQPQMTFLIQTKMNKTTAKELVLVFAGGAIGALLRYLIAVALEQAVGPNGANALSLYIVNIAGAIFLGWINTSPKSTTQLFWGAGFAGGFTTMSGVAVFLYTQSPATAIPTVAIMFGLGFIGYAAGNNLGRVQRTKK